MARVYDPEIPKPLRQVAPGNARAVAIENGLNEKTIVARRHTNIRGLARQKQLNPLPLIITKGISAHLASNPWGKLTPHEALKKQFGKPLFDDTA